MTLGVPEEQLALVRGIKNEDDLLNKGMTRAISHVLLTGIGEAPEELQKAVTHGSLLKSTVEVN